MRRIRHAAELQIPGAGKAGLLVDPEGPFADTLLVDQRSESRLFEEVAGRRIVAGGLADVFRYGDEQENQRTSRRSNGRFFAGFEVEAGASLGCVFGSLPCRLVGDFRVSALPGCRRPASGR